MFVSGFADKAETLAGTVAQTAEDVGDGSVTVFGYEPNFRAVTDASAILLRQAILRTPTGSLRAATTRPKQSVRGPAVLKLSHSRAWRLAHEEGERPRR
jgi:hypothetical protein